MLLTLPRRGRLLGTPLRCGAARRWGTTDYLQLKNGQAIEGLEESLGVANDAVHLNNAVPGGDGRDGIVGIPACDEAIGMDALHAEARTMYHVDPQRRSMRPLQVEEERRTRRRCRNTICGPRGGYYRRRGRTAGRLFSFSVSAFYRISNSGGRLGHLCDDAGDVGRGRGVAGKKRRRLSLPKVSGGGTGSSCPPLGGGGSPERAGSHGTRDPALPRTSTRRRGPQDPAATSHPEQSASTSRASTGSD